MGLAGREISCPPPTLGRKSSELMQLLAGDIYALKPSYLIVNVSDLAFELWPKLLMDRVLNVWVPIETGDDGVNVYASVCSSKAPSRGITPLSVKKAPSNLLELRSPREIV